MDIIAVIIEIFIAMAKFYVYAWLFSVGLLLILWAIVEFRINVDQVVKEEKEDLGNEERN